MPAVSDILQFFRGQLFQTPSLPTVNLVGKTFVVTGANTGLGFECAKHLANLNASTIVLGCRDVKNGKEAKAELLADKRLANTIFHVWPIDMANYESVQQFVTQLSSELPRVDGVVCNAGISMKDYTQAEGLEATLTVNVVVTFFLALLALPKLQYTASKHGEATYLTIVGSVVHCFAAHEQLQAPSHGEVFKTLSQPKTADMAARYFLSKLMVMQCVQELAKQVSLNAKASTPVVVNCVNPGWCKTGLFRNDDGGPFARNLLRVIGRTGEIGARTLVHAVTAGPDSHGHYLSECQVKPASVFVRSYEGEQTQVKIWTELMDLLSSISPDASRGLQ